MDQMQGGGYLTLLKKRNFLLLWLAQLISQIIFNAANFALLNLVSGTEKNQSATNIAIAIICFTIPTILFGAPSGVFVDHMNKRRVLWSTNTLRAVAIFAFVLTLLFARGALILVYLLTFLISTITQFFVPAEGSTIPLLVNKKELTAALSLFSITITLSQAVGYAVGPAMLFLLPQFGFAGLKIDSMVQLYTIIGILYLVCAGLILLIPNEKFIQGTRPKHTTGPVTTQTLQTMNSVWQEMMQGWGFVRGKKPLFLAVVQLSFAGVFILVIGEIAIPIVTGLLDLPKEAMIFIFAPAGIGLVGVTALIPRIMQRVGRSRTILSGAIGLAFVTTLLPLTALLAHFLNPSPSWNSNPLLLLIIALLMFAAGVALALVNVPALSGMQELTPDWIKGRVIALQLVLYSICSLPVLLFIGLAIDQLGIDRVLYIMSACSLAFGAWGVYYARKHRLPTLQGETEHRQKQVEPDKIGPGPLKTH